MSTQQKLVELAPNHAIMNIDVLSFKRLAYRVFDEMGRNDIRVLEETGKNLVLKKLARREEEHLTVLRPNMNRMGYIGEVKSLISELVQYNVSPDRLEDVARRDELSPVLRAKLQDIVTMYRAFTDFMEGSYITAEEILNILSELAKDSAILRDSVLVFDEFTGFTPIQNDLMRQLLQVAERVIVTLTVPAGTLAVGDYTVTPSPVAPGTYQVSLTDSGIEKIKKAISTSENYVWNNTGNGVLEIVNAKANYQMSGSGETTYTGSAVELPMDQLKDAISSSNTVSG